ncbi:hypothetical protein [Halobacillus andaensis]|uniref:hypothetical protein n=1 Tax=Halobacillus andaensis TaxID=1176239 RepID=UPI003D72207F
MTKHKLFNTLSLLCLITCIALWIPNIIFQIPSGAHFNIFYIAPVGVLFAIFTKTKWLIISNIVAFFSFFWLMTLGYIIAAIVDYFS